MGEDFKTKIFFIFLISALFLPAFSFADSLGQIKIFQVDPSYDFSKREEISAILEKISQNAYFYLEDAWYKSLADQDREKVKQSLEAMAREFDNVIYPKLTENYGSEWKPGIDNDYRITIFFHKTQEGSAGYFRSKDEYFKEQMNDSNEREMIYVNSDYINEPAINGYLAHEFTHLITFNQKERLRGVSEEVWLNEARAEYAPTLLGYDNDFSGSNLERRVRAFLEKPYDSLTEWTNSSQDYGVINLFTQYLVDQYGVKVLTGSFASKRAGILSINDALLANGFKEDFSEIFTNWTITLLLNDCRVGPKYCYLNQNLKNLRVMPQTNFLPIVGQSSLSVANLTKDWSVNWQKIVGGQKNLKLEFQGGAGAKFKIPYLIEDAEGKITINFLVLDQNQKGTIIVQDFNSKNKSLTIIPSVQTKVSGFDGLEAAYQFSFIASTLERTPEQEADLITKLLAKIELLQKEIAKVQAQIDAILNKKPATTCQKIENNLYVGLVQNEEVRCLQDFLKKQGTEIYPEGMVTGNFGSLTQLAVIRFQEKYAEEILKPLGLERGTGYVGEGTRAKINRIITGS